MSHRIRAGLAMTVIAIVLLTMTGTAQAVVAATIRGSGTSWNPTRVTINAGQTVRWKATSGDHTIHSYGGNWSFSRTLDAGRRAPARSTAPGRSSSTARSTAACRGARARGCAARSA